MWTEPNKHVVGGDQHRHRASIHDCQRLTCNNPAEFTLIVVGRRETRLCGACCMRAQEGLEKDGVNHRREVYVHG